MRLVTMLVCLGLAGCAATEPGNDTVLTGVPGPQASAPMATPPVAAQPLPGPPAAPQPMSQPAPQPMSQPAPQPMPQPVATPQPPPPVAETRPASAISVTGPRGTAVTRTPPPEPTAEPEPPMTHERASALCWMKYEDGRKKLSLDQRADLVDKCVKTTLATGEKPTDDPPPARRKRR